MNTEKINSIPVKDARQKNIKITKNPIIYYWWFNKKCISRLLKPLEGACDLERIKFEKKSSFEYGLLYIGKAKNGHDRLIKYHLLDNSGFHEKGVENGRLSSLRQTLCGLLRVNMSQAKIIVNNFMDNNCYIEWKEVSLERIE